MGIKGVDLSIVQYQNPIRRLHGGDSLSDNNLGRSRNLPGESRTNAGVRRRIHSAGGIVKDQDLRFLQKGSRDTQTLLLPPDTLAPPRSILL